MKKVFEGKVGQFDILIRYLENGDLEEMHRYINVISKEKRILLSRVKY